MLNILFVNQIVNNVCVVLKKKSLFLTVSFLIFFIQRDSVFFFKCILFFIYHNYVCIMILCRIIFVRISFSFFCLCSSLFSFFFFLKILLNRFLVFVCSFIRLCVKTTTIQVTNPPFLRSVVKFVCIAFQQTVWNRFR